jgi:uncharacterized RDD family membrane protein YckC
MTCIACGQTIEVGESQCPFCGTAVPKRSDLVLEPTPPRPSQPADKTPQAREPAVRRREERPWRDEVRERVHERRRDRGFETDLPLFAPRRESARPTPPPANTIPDQVLDAKEASDELSLRPASEVTPGPRSFDNVEDSPDRAESERESLAPTTWLLDETPSPGEVSAAERPASGLERAQAAAVDAALLAVVWGLILYFAGKATRVGLAGLRPSWSVVTGYLLFVGLIYAAYFTGVSGRTPGKMVMGLRVVDTYGRAPGFFRALLRVVFGTLGTLAAGLGLLFMIFDPARRALHDRLFKTRVIRT